MSTLEAKTVNEVKYFNIDFSDQIPAGEEIATAVWTVPDDLTGDNESLIDSDTKAQIRISGGLANVEYALKCVVTTTSVSNPQITLERGFILLILDTPAGALVTDGITTISRVALVLALSGTSTDSTIINLLGVEMIRRATDAVQSYLGYPIKEQEHVENVAGFPGNILMVGNLPIKEIDSIELDGVVIDSTRYRIHNAKAGLIWLDDGVVDTVTRRNDLSFSSYANNGNKLYQVTYTAGWILPGNAGRNLPYDIENAGLEYIKLLANSPSNPNIKSESLDGVYDVTYQDQANGDNIGTSLPKSIADMLNPYKAVAL
jgi:hypothetical protein